METDIMDSTPAGRLKHKVNVSYAEYRELEKSWMAARALVCGLARLLVSIRDLSQARTVCSCRQQQLRCSSLCL